MRIGTQSRHASLRASLSPTNRGHPFDPMPASSSVCGVRWLLHARSRIPRPHPTPIHCFRSSGTPTRSTPPPKQPRISVGMYPTSSEQLHRNNTWEPDWATFFWKWRLLPQLRLAIDLIPSSRWTKLENAFFRIMKGHVPQPSFLHGDLWSGNAASIAEREPVVFDPASYFGDRETDIAFTHMFGGFPQGFYHAYNEEWPLPEDHSRRETAYNLYHSLNHLNLFGSGYLQSTIQSIETLLLNA